MKLADLDHPIHTKKILVADDEPAMRELLGEMFRTAGFEHLIFASNGSAVLDLAVAENPQLIVLDVMMPRGNGLRALRSLREHPKTSGIPVIMMSGFGLGALTNAAGEFTSHFLAKPFTCNELIDRASGLLSERLTGTSRMPYGDPAAFV
ncbi:response regulator receiver domain-containing protein [Roseimicrobium gellanilyticum]|uniref:Response regulator receiver domain-containing protein n=1 Tax=Roseimicrobium gellanilyticum TaxID=748857 RepID=A0A366HNF1_9BACT|nr:response regulator [Roseimicrobium gellanilyticum]RBP45040.1 response regulator receiver domain-containing protein [Roseimicrobium gellanilyticum]